MNRKNEPFKLSFIKVNAYGEKSMEKLIRKQDWLYENAGMDWRDGLLLGNGELGVAAYAPSHLEWVVNKVDVFDPTVEKGLLEKMIPHAEFLRRIRRMNPKNTLFLRELEKARTEQPENIRNTLSAAVLRLRFWRGIGWSAPAVPRTSQHLSLYDGILHEQMEAHRFHPRLRMFVPRENGLFCLRITEPEYRDRCHILELVRPPNEILEPPVWKSGASSLSFLQKLPGGESSYAVCAFFVPKNGGSEAAPSLRQGVWAEMTQSGDADLFLAVKTSYEAADPLSAAEKEAAEAAEKTFDVLEREHLAWWHHYWDNAYADFGKYHSVQKYFTFGLYALACSFGKAPMPGLNGLSYGPLGEQIPGVGCQGYTHDQNAQIPSMPFGPLNRTEFIRVLADTYLNARETLREHTRRLFGCGGIFLPLAANQLGMEYPTRAYRYTLCGSAYTGLVLSMAWRYSRDETLLREKIYPLLREFAEFYTGILQKGGDGVYHLDWSVTPEIFTLTRDETATLSMLKVCLETLVEAAALLHTDADRLPLWKDILAHYPEIARTPSGAFWCGPDVPFDHYFYGGHILYPFFPAAITQDLKGARKTLELINRDAIERSFADRSGQRHMNHEWSQFLTTAARLRAGDRAGGWNGLQRFLELFAKENGLFSHDPILIADPAETEKNERKYASRLRRGRRWCDGSLLTDDNPEVPHPMCATPNPNAKRLAPAVLEGTSAFLFLAAETLLQSHGGILRLFPGVPGDFSGSLDRFLAEGAFEVSAKMKNGKTVSVRIHSLRGGTVRLENPFGKLPRVLLRTLKKGESVTLTEKNARALKKNFFLLAGPSKTP
ncbi:MAG: hypothetical protein BWY31_03041 [Lentisphaerae bacterium ADurb.Bin242]|nr:MAG: hypothetical protein BWY31_03041 [Lentisphaerae bacterium ADurb.Bin242]